MITLSGDEPAIDVRDLRRTYTVRQGRARTEREALRSVTFDVARGQLFGVLGPNGAGKTTLIRILSTLLTPSRGSARILGLDVTTDRKALRRRIGILFGGDRGLYTRISGRDNLRYFAGLYGLRGAEAERRIAYLLDRVGLADRADEKVHAFSRGMKQRLHLARVLVHAPEVVFLDEPTIGLDPVIARDIRALIADLAAAGMTVIITSHYMYEAEALCSQVLVMDKGEVLTRGTPHELRRVHRDLRRVDAELDPAAEGVEELLRPIVGPDAVIDLVDEGAQKILRLRSANATEVLAQVERVLHPYLRTPLSVREPTLEDVYVRLIEDHRRRTPAGVKA